MTIIILPIVLFLCFSRGHDQFLVKFMIKPTVHAIQRGSPLCFFVIEATRVHLDISQYIPVARLDRWSRRFPKWWRCSCGFRCSTWVDQWGFAYSLPRKWGQFFRMKQTCSLIICPAPKNRSIRCKRLWRTCKKWTGQVAPNPSEIMKGWLSEKGVDSGRLLRIQRDTWRSKRLVDRHGRPPGVF